MVSKSIQIAVSGDKGSFSELAGHTCANKLSSPVNLLYAIDMEGVLRLVESGGADLGVFPVHNTIGHLVESALEAMGRHHYTYVDQLELEIRHCLMTLPGITLEDITEVISHEQPFLQCSDYVAERFSHIPHRNYPDMAQAARDLNNGRLPRTAAIIGSEMASEINMLRILEQDVQNKSSNNITTFIIVSK